jgi:hypothetical protein
VNTEVRKMSRRSETQAYWDFSWFTRGWRTWRRTARRVYEAVTANIFYQETADLEEGQLREELRTAVLTAEKLEKDLNTICKSMEDVKRLYMKRMEELQEWQNELRAIFTEHVRDDSSNESEPEGNDIDRDDPAEEGDIS